MATSSLGMLLDQHPGLRVDLIDAVWGQRFKRYIGHRLSTFRSCLRGDAQARLTPDKILSFLNSSRCQRISYLRNLTVGRYEDIPLLSKRDIQKNPTEFIDRDIAHAWYKATSGSSGTPLRILYSPAFYLEQKYLDVLRILERRSIMLSGIGGALCLHLTDTKVTPSTVSVSPLYPRHLYAIAHTESPDLQWMLTDLRPFVISSRPELLEFFARGHGQHMMPGVVISAGSYLSEERRAIINTQWGVPCVNAYSMSEFGTIASECGYGNLHVDESSVYVEILDNCGGQSPAGAPGELVISSVLNTAQPLLRYRTGDRGFVKVDKCLCGCTSPSLHIIEGRLVPLFRFQGGMILSPTCFNDLPFAFPIRDYRVAQSSECELRISVEPLEMHLAASTELIDSIRCFVARKVPRCVRVKVDVVHFDVTKKRERYVVLNH